MFTACEFAHSKIFISHSNYFTCYRFSQTAQTEKTKLNLESRCSSLRKHLSKSASELSCKECTTSATNESITPFPSPKRAKSAAAPNVASVLQRTSGFLNNLKVSHRHHVVHKVIDIWIFFFSLLQSRWARGRSKERGRKSPGSGTLLDDDRDNSDYAADNSDSSVTPFESPRHRASTLTDSPLARPRNNNNHLNDSPSNNRHELTTKASLTGIDCEPSTSYLSANQQLAYDVIHVSWSRYEYLIKFKLSIIRYDPFSERRSHASTWNSTASTFIFSIEIAFSERS